MKRIFLVLILMMTMLVSSVSALDYWHGDTCDRPDGVAAQPKILNKPIIGRLSLEQGTTAYFDVDVTGLETGYAVCEFGIYYQEEASKWMDYPYSIGAWDQLTGNCMDGENFVITHRFYVQSGQTERVTFGVAVPSHYDNSEDFVGRVNCFNHCYLCDPDTYTGYGSDYIKLDLHGTEVLPDNHCDNYKTDVDESDMDCGGEECEKCPIGLRCKEDSDCITNVCTNSVCQSNADPVISPDVEEPLDIPVLYIVFGVLAVLLIFASVMMLR